MAFRRQPSEVSKNQRMILCYCESVKVKSESLGKKPICHWRSVRNALYQ